MPAKHLVVDTHTSPDTPLLEERKALDAPDIDFQQRGPCNTEQEVLEAVRDAEVALCMMEPYTRLVMENSPKLKLVLRYGVGYDSIDVKAATENGIMVGNFPDFCTREVANHALTMLLACAKKLVRLDRAVRQGGRDAARKVLAPMGAIHGETLGLLAFGNIARQVAKRGLCLDMNVIAYDPFADQSVFDEMGVESVSLDELAQRADYVSCHMPLLDATRGMIGAEFFGQMKPTAYFINTSRGAVVDEAALIEALREGRIAGAGLDVIADEPITADHPFASMDNVILTPHTAPYAEATMSIRAERVGRSAAAVARGGLPEFVVNKEVLESRRK